ncbi:hypothetical protein [Polluticoccus soli]|uniref:hypothetical protein n=1 Tax=Polluticoccus soli TaxID=3034150 RepID=UPI0023E2F4ED|nr:hypothetical protein [Flavipsychrobacter sp. JY13-12]
MKLYYLLLVAILTAAACKKHERLTPATPPPPTKDFREKYTGTFNITKLHSNWSYSGGTFFYRSSDTFTGILQISYNIKDSSSRLGSGGDFFNQPALTFIYGNGLKERCGVDTFGRLYRSINPAHPNQGGFVTADSIFHTSTYIGNSRSDDTLYGRRIK